MLLVALFTVILSVVRLRVIMLSVEVPKFTYVEIFIELSTGANVLKLFCP
jgi:hypothetical protein